MVIKTCAIPYLVPASVDLVGRDPCNLKLKISTLYNHLLVHGILTILMSDDVTDVTICVQMEPMDKTVLRVAAAKTAANAMLLTVAASAKMDGSYVFKFVYYRFHLPYSSV